MVSRIEAEQELKLAGQLNPGPWVEHSFNVGKAARNIAERCEKLDPEKAYIMGILHDIGRRVGVVSIPRHVYEGYQYTNSKGWQ
ncbi:MAG: HDOD domain-containing protein, partial [Cellulosilyticaceae bacterium]